MKKFKIFGIGLPKTGTTSLHKALTILGFNSCDDYDLVCSSLEDEVRNDRKIMSCLIDRYDAFSDYPICYMFDKILEEYPNEKYIYTYRDMDSWLISRKNELTKRYGFYLDGKIKDTILWKRHDSLVRRRFEDKDNLITLNIVGGDGWEKLCRFLEVDVPDVDFPFENKGVYDEEGSADLGKNTLR